jgi:mediator of RNA polymerase II transcription subunit 12
MRKLILTVAITRNSSVISLRFSTLLFAEKLLDREHFLDWLLSFISTCSLDTFPICLLFVEMYWSDLLQSRKTACRLAEGLLGKMQTVSAHCSLIAIAQTFRL